MINFAHRGASKYYPENTILSIKEGIKAGAEGIEIDVHKTKDNRLVVIHDEDIERTFKGKGLVKDYTLAKLKEFKCRNKVFQENLDCRIPTLEEVLEIIKVAGIMLNIELKTDEIHYEGIEKDVIDLVNKYDLKDKVILSSFNHESIKMVRQIDSEIKTGLLYEKPIKDIIKYAKIFGAYAIHPDKRLVTEELLREAIKNNIKVNIYTVNSPIIMRKLIKAGANGLFTDYPDLLNEIIKEIT
jgi:glycerophosphoryl diester phosphodiesterase